jgi:hypothetical protein
VPTGREHLWTVPFYLNDELLLKRLAWTDQLSEEEQNLLIGAVSRIQSFAPGETIVPAEVPVDFSSVILQGLSKAKGARKWCPADYSVSFGRRFLRFAHLCAEDFAR